MYLMAIGNIDYIVITAIFAIFFIIAYRFRRHNQTVNKFLFGGSHIYSSNLNHWILGFGIIEFMVLGMLGAKYGLSSLYSFLLSFILAYIGQLYVVSVIGQYSIFEYFSKKVGSRFPVVYAILCVLLMSLLIIIAALIMAKLCRSLLGWNFANSVFAVFGLTEICLIIGGYQALRYTRMLQSIVVFAIFFIILAIAIYVEYPLADKFQGLESLAINMGHNASYFSRFNILPPIVYLSLPLLFLLPIIAKQNGYVSIYEKVIAKSNLVCMILMILVGLLAILTPLPLYASSNGGRVVTYQAQLPNGEVGYVVKSIDVGTNKKVDVAPGLIPPLLDAKTSLVIPNSYDYTLANMVTIRHYLNNSLVNIVLLTIIISFMLSLGQYLLAIVKIIVFDIYVPSGWLKNYGEDGLLWLSRMSIVFIGGFIIFLANFLLPYLLDVWFIYICVGLAAFLSITTFAMIVFYGPEKE